MKRHFAILRNAAGEYEMPIEDWRNLLQTAGAQGWRPASMRKAGFSHRPIPDVWMDLVQRHHGLDAPGERMPTGGTGLSVGADDAGRLGRIVEQSLTGGTALVGASTPQGSRYNELVDVFRGALPILKHGAFEVALREEDIPEEPAVQPQLKNRDYWRGIFMMFFDSLAKKKGLAKRGIIDTSEPWTFSMAELQEGFFQALGDHVLAEFGTELTQEVR